MTDDTATDTPQAAPAVGARLEPGVRLQLAAAPKERPILFSAPMVRAVLAGTKTQTRRVMKPDGRYRLELVCHTDGGPSRCPYGAPGDRLYVREAWARDSEDGQMFYRADVGSGNEADCWERNRLEGAPNYRWRPSIHMLRRDSRIDLKIEAVRVERLNDISEADALAEGVTPKWEPGCSGRLMEAFSGFSFRPAASAYADLWEQINGAGSWESNPWVWVVEFRRVHLQPNVAHEARP